MDIKRKQSSLLQKQSRFYQAQDSNETTKQTSPPVHSTTPLKPFVYQPYSATGLMSISLLTPVIHCVHSAVLLVNRFTWILRAVV